MWTIMTWTHHPPTLLLTMGPQGCFVHCWNGPGCTPSPLEWAPNPHHACLYLPQCQVMKSWPMHTPAPVASLLLVGAPPGCLPDISSSTLSRFFTVGPHPDHPPTMPSPRATTRAPSHTLWPPSVHPCTLLHPIF